MKGPARPVKITSSSAYWSIPPSILFYSFSVRFLPYIALWSFWIGGCLNVVTFSPFVSLSPTLRPRAFLQGWTCKEALLKAIGSGVRDLQNCRVYLNPDEPPAVIQSPGTGRWILAVGEVEPGVSWAVAEAG